MNIRPVFDIKCEDCVYYRGKQPDGLILCSVPEGKCYKFHEAGIPPQTNGDKLREMSNEELAEFIGCNSCPPGTGDKCQSGIDCATCWASWLNTEAKED